MRVESTKSTRKREQAIANLMLCPTIAEAAKSTGIAEATLFRWMKDDTFIRPYRQARREAVSQATAQLQQAAGDAVRTLREVMTDSELPASARVTAARAVLELAFRAVELEDLEERVIALEETPDVSAELDAKLEKLRQSQMSRYTDEELSQMRTIHETAEARVSSKGGRQDELEEQSQTH